MARNKIPFQDLASFTLEYAFDNELKKIALQWNDRKEFWGFSLYTLEDIPILIGKKLVVNFEMFNDYYATEGIPKGKLYIVHHRVYNQRVTQHDFFNNVCSLVYEDADV